jgi:hypothetical protein
MIKAHDKTEALQLGDKYFFFDLYDGIDNIIQSQYGERVKDG